LRSPAAASSHRAAPADFNADRSSTPRLVVAPGLVDLAARLREPGHEHEGMLESELAAAAAGGVTSLVCPPDTDPVLDEPGLVEMLKFRARKLLALPAVPAGRADPRPARRALTEMVQLTDAGCIGFSQADVPLRRHPGVAAGAAVRHPPSATPCGCAPGSLAGKGCGRRRARGHALGLSGVPVAAETIALHTIFELMRDRARVHLCRLSSAAGVALLRRPSAEGLPVTADVSINSLHLTDNDIGYFNADLRLNPPLRQLRRPRCACAPHWPTAPSMPWCPTTTRWPRT
jgi:dihydroorotase